MKRNKRIGIMGGTFNPIHDAHIMMAKIAYEELGLDRVLLMPSNIPPHKQGIAIASAQDRSRMVRLAIEGIEGLSFSDFELKREGTTYSVETMTLLKQENPDTDYYFIIGADSLFAIDTWYQPEILLSLVTTVVFARDGREKAEIEKKIHELKNSFQCSILFLEMPYMPVSSTEIRQSFRKGRIPDMIPEAVVRYIMEKGLYR